MKRHRCSRGRDEALLREIADTIDDVFYVRTRGVGITYVSPSYERVRGEPPQKLLAAGEMGWESIWPADRYRLSAALERLRFGESYDLEYRFIRPDGTVRWVRDRAYPIRDATGEVVRDIGVITDITDRRSLEDELHQMQKMEAIGALASGIAHDFNNVLQVVIGICEMVANHEVPDDRVPTMMRRVTGAAERGADLVRQLMAFARKDPSQPRSIDLGVAVVDATRLVRRLVTTQITVDLSLLAPRSFVHADPVQIEQILLNLATNARDAMPDGGKLHIATRAIELEPDEARSRGLVVARSYVCLSVQDTGSGMSDEVKQRVLEPFYTTKDVGHGTGLGLATVDAVMRQLGGRIEIDSVIGAGTTFRLMFPCTEPPQDPESRKPEPLPELHASILVVDDDPAVRRTIRSFLEAAGADVMEARSGEQALELAPGSDLVVTDIVMPAMCGTQLREGLEASGCPVLLMSGHSLGHYVTQGLLDPSDPFLQKPFSQRDLVTAVAALLHV